MIKLDKKLRTDLEDTLYQEELLWYQRFREEWITSGDHNTRFYHLDATVRNNNVKVNALRDEEGNWVTDTNQLTNLICEYFQRLYTEEQLLNPQQNQYGCFLLLCDDDWNEVNKPFQAEEIQQALFDMEPCKVPRPDGFTAGFYQKALNTEYVNQLRPIGLCNISYKLVTKVMT